MKTKKQDKPFKKSLKGKTEEKLKKGCGQKTYHSLDGYNDKEYCREFYLCKECELELKGYQKGFEDGVNDGINRTFDISIQSAKAQTIKEEIEFLEKLKMILNNYHSSIPMVEIGRQNVLDDIDNELKLDERINNLKQQIKKLGELK